MPRYVYIRNGPAWQIIDTSKNPAEMVALVIDGDATTRSNQIAQKIVDLLQGDHDYAEQIRAVRPDAGTPPGEPK